uniref:NADH dehydrogenase subunit 4 n=1 Tax=Onukigallia onukii TaxID=1792642 RepID=UPI00300220B9|nr:NADH dehydrogenase subunit 4 [Onukigallia onukii]
MMGIFIYLIFLTLFVFNGMWNLTQFGLVLIIFFFIFNNFDFFFCNLSYSFGLDSFSFGLIFLSIFIVSLMMLSKYNLFSINYSSFLLFMNFMLYLSLFLVFSVLNIFMMYVFFEFSLVPLLVMIFGWGYQPERLISGLYLFFYTLFASLPLFLLITHLYLNYYSLFFDYYFGFSLSFIIHFIMIFAFLVKFPLFMLHFWLPKAHVHSPVYGSMILAGLLLKIGGYGIIRFMYIYEAGFLYNSYIWYSLSIYGSFIVSLICLIQGDMKCLIAYSSVAHMGLCLMGLLSMSKFGLLGSYFLMIGHGFCSSGLFYLANVSYERLLSRSFYLNKGMIIFMPTLTMFWFIFCSFNMSCPPSLNFLSEIFIMMSMISYWSYSFIYLIMISFFSAFFSFFLFSYSQHGSYHNCYSFSFVSFCEYLVIYLHMIPILLLIFLINSYF